MFQFAGLARTALWIQAAVLGVAPFGNSRINSATQLLRLLLLDSTPQLPQLITLADASPGSLNR